MTRQILIPDRIFNSIAGTILEDHAVVIDDDRIDSVIPTAEVSGETTQVLDGYTLLPGLIDVHTHLAVPLDDGQGFASARPT